MDGGAPSSLRGFALPRGQTLDCSTAKSGGPSARTADHSAAEAKSTGGTEHTSTAAATSSRGGAGEGSIAAQDPLITVAAAAADDCYRGACVNLIHTAVAHHDHDDIDDTVDMMMMEMMNLVPQQHHHDADFNLLYDSDTVQGHDQFVFCPNSYPNPSHSSTTTTPGPDADDSWLLPSCIPQLPPQSSLRRDWSLSTTSWQLPPAAAAPGERLFLHVHDSTPPAGSRAVVNAAALRLSDISAALSPTSAEAHQATSIALTNVINDTRSDSGRNQMNTAASVDSFDQTVSKPRAAPEWSNTVSFPPVGEERAKGLSEARRRGRPAKKSANSITPAVKKPKQKEAEATESDASATAGNVNVAANISIGLATGKSIVTAAGTVAGNLKAGGATAEDANPAGNTAANNMATAETTSARNALSAGSKTAGAIAAARAAAEAPPVSDPLEKTLRHVDDLIQRTSTALNSGGSFLLAAASHRRPARRSRKSTKLANKSHPNNNHVVNPAVDLLLNLAASDQISANPGVMSSNPKQTKPAITSYKRHIHIQSERQRRKGMTHLYATLHSLIMPCGRKIKTDRCSVLTETMKYIQALLKQIEELKQKRQEIMTSTCKLLAPPQKRRRIMNIVRDHDHENNTNKVGDLLNDDEDNIELNIDESIEVMNVEESLIDEWMCGTQEVAGEELGINDDILIGNDRIQTCSIDNNQIQHAHKGDFEVIENIKYVSIWDQVNGEVMNNNFGHVLQGGVMSFDYKESLAENSNSDNDDDEGDYPNTEVGVRLYGGEAFVTLRTLRMRGGLWSGVLEILLDHHIDIINVNLSTSPDFDFHCIHAKVPSNIDIHCSQLQKLLKDFVCGKPGENKLYLITEANVCNSM